MPRNLADELYGGGNEGGIQPVVPPDVQRKRDEEANRLRAQEVPPAPPVQSTAALSEKQLMQQEVGGLPARRRNLAQTLYGGGGRRDLTKMLYGDAPAAPEPEGATLGGIIKQFGEAFTKAAADYTRAAERFGLTPEAGGALTGEAPPGLREALTGEETPDTPAGQRAAELGRRMGASMEAREQAAGTVGKLALGAARFFGSTPLVPLGTPAMVAQGMVNGLDEAYARNKDRGFKDAASLQEAGEEAVVSGITLGAWGKTAGTIENSVGSIVGRYGMPAVRHILGQAIAATGLGTAQTVVDDYLQRLEIPDPNEDFAHFTERVVRDAKGAALGGFGTGLVMGGLGARGAARRSRAAELNDANTKTEETIAQNPPPPQSTKPRIKGLPGVAVELPDASRGPEGEVNPLGEARSPVTSSTSAHIHSLDEPEEGYVRIYRAEPLEKATGTKQPFEGRWGTTDEQGLQGYIDRMGGNDNVEIKYADFPEKDVERYRASNNQEELGPYSTAPDREFFLPKDTFWAETKAPAGYTREEIEHGNKGGAEFKNHPWIDQAVGGVARVGEVRVSPHDADKPWLARYASVIQGLLDRFKIRTGFVLGSDGMRNSINSRASVETLPDGPSGHYISTGRRSSVIHLKESETKDTESGAHTTIHEFGHGLVKYMFDKAPYAIQQALKTEYLRLFREAPMMSYRDFMTRFHGAPKAERMLRNWKNTEAIVQEDWLARNRTAYRFSEWLAEQFAQTEGSRVLRDTPEGRYMTRAVAQMERVYAQGAKDLGLSETFSSWIQGLADRGEPEDWVHEKVLDQLHAELDQVVRASLGLVGAEKNFFRHVSVDDLAKLETYLSMLHGTLVPQARDALLAGTWDPRTGINVEAFLKAAGNQDTGHGWRVAEGEEYAKEPPGPSEHVKKLDRTMVNLEASGWIRTPEGKDVKEQRKQLQKNFGIIDDYNWFLAKHGSVLDIGKVNEHVPGVKALVDEKQMQHITKMDLQTRALDKIRDWRNLGKAKAKLISEVLFQEDMEKRFLTQKELAQKGFDARTKAVYDRIHDSFREITQRMERAAIHSAIITIGRGGQGAANLLGGRNANQVVADIRAKFRLMRDKPYFPHSRFGEKGLIVRAAKDFMYNKQQYKKGEKISVTHHESSTERDNALGAMWRDMGQGNLTHQLFEVQDKAFMGLQGLPQHFADYLAKKLGMTPDQIDRLREVQYEMAPSQSFLKHLLARKGIAGYSRDAQRVYAQYMRNAASTLARLEHQQRIEDSLQDIKDSAAAVSKAGGDPGPRLKLAKWFEDAEEYSRNPGSDWSELRALGFMFYLGLNAKSAVVNLVQPVMTTYPYLAARYGDARAVLAMSKAMAKSLTANTVTDLIAAKAGFKTPSSRLLSANEANMLDQGRHEGWTDESQGAMLSSVADPNVLARYMNNTSMETTWRIAGNISSFMFRQAELFNRKITALAAYDLAQQKGKNHYESVAVARDAVQATQFEYASWNRPGWVRGKKGALFLFAQYEANMLKFMTPPSWKQGGDPGWWRSMGVMAVLAGASGLPLAGMLMDVYDIIKSKIAGPDVKQDVRRDLTKMLDELGVNSDLVMNGISRYTMGLGLIPGMPQLDISSSIGMGYTRFLGGKDLAKDLSSGDAKRLVADQVENWGGPIASFGVNAYKAYASDDLDSYKRWSQMLPPFAKALGEAWRREDPNSTLAQSLNPMLPWYLQAMGGVRDRSGAITNPYDYEDAESRVEHMAKYFNFESTTISQNREIDWRLNETLNFYKGRRAYLTKSLAVAYGEDDREAIADAKAAIERYNDSVPYVALKLGYNDLHRAIQERLKKKGQVERGIPEGASKRFYDVYRDFDEQRRSRARTTPSDSEAPDHLGP